MSNNQTLFERAQRTIPGGVNSPVRAFRSVGGTPRFVARAQGAYFWDADGKRYIDYIGSWGPMIVGHVHPDVLAAVQRVLADGFSFGAPTEAEIEIAEEICKLVPSIEQVRMVSSGTEATMSALRLARGFTGRSRIVKFEGCYHGHADSLLVKAGSGLLTFGNPTSAGVPADVAKHTTVLEYNNVAALEEAFAAFGGEIAAVIVEPVAGNMNLVRGTPEFLNALRALTAKHGAVLIFDEVMCGFRVALGGAQQHYGITPDLTCLGKVIGGGMPAAAFGGRGDIMSHLAPLGGVYQAGTLSGNPVAVAATFIGIVRDALCAMMGAEAQPLTRYPAVFDAPLNKRAGRPEYLRGRAARDASGVWRVAPAGSQSSASLKSLSDANCFIVLAHDAARVDAGTTVDILPFDGAI